MEILNDDVKNKNLDNQSFNHAQRLSINNRDNAGEKKFIDELYMLSKKALNRFYVALSIFILCFLYFIYILIAYKKEWFPFDIAKNNLLLILFLLIPLLIICYILAKVFKKNFAFSKKIKMLIFDIPVKYDIHFKILEMIENKYPKIYNQFFINNYDPRIKNKYITIPGYVIREVNIFLKNYLKTNSDKFDSNNPYK